MNHFKDLFEEYKDIRCFEYADEVKKCEAHLKYIEELPDVSLDSLTGDDYIYKIHCILKSPNGVSENLLLKIKFYYYCQIINLINMVFDGGTEEAFLLQQLNSIIGCENKLVEAQAQNLINNREYFKNKFISFEKMLSQDEYFFDNCKRYYEILKNLLLFKINVRYNGMAVACENFEDILGATELIEVNNIAALEDVAKYYAPLKIYSLHNRLSLVTTIDQRVMKLNTEFFSRILKINSMYGGVLNAVEHLFWHFNNSGEVINEILRLDLNANHYHNIARIVDYIFDDSGDANNIDYMYFDHILANIHTHLSITSCGNLTDFTHYILTLRRARLVKFNIDFESYLKLMFNFNVLKIVKNKDTEIVFTSDYYWTITYLINNFINKMKGIIAKTFIESLYTPNNDDDFPFKMGGKGFEEKTLKLIKSYYHLLEKYDNKMPFEWNVELFMK